MKTKAVRIKFVVEEKIFSNEKTSFAVLNGISNNVNLIAVGKLFSVDEGEILTLTGNFVYNKTYGKQFKVLKFTRGLPNTKRTIIKFLAAGNIRGLKEKTAEKIVEHFGLESLEILEKNPERLSEVKGIGGAFLERIKKDFKNFISLKNLNIFLQQFNISSLTCLKIWAKWGVFSQSKIESNPYCVCSNDIGVSFFVAENIAKILNVEKNNENRVLAALEYVLYHNALENGHSCVPKESLKAVVGSFLKIEKEEVEEILNVLIEKNKLYLYETKKKFVFLPIYYLTERYIAKRLVEAKSYFAELEAKELENLILIEEERLKIKFAKAQKKAIKKALEHGVFILNGGPGTGKTTILTAVISILEQSGLNVAVCAPTGKAAKRLETATGRQATTIHRLLGVEQLDENKKEFVHGEKKLLKTDALILDEMSMVDCLLFGSLLKALKKGCRLIFSGDFNQLPCISAGNLLKNMLASKVLPSVELTSIFRQAKKSLIITNAHNIINEKELTFNVKGKDFFFVERNSHAEVLKTILNIVKNKLTKILGDETNKKLQVICPCKKGIVGTIELNRKLQEIFNPASKNKNEFELGFYIFREGDRVIQTKNNYEAVWQKDSKKGEGIFNGEIGDIVEINIKKGLFKVDFSGKMCELDLNLAKDLEPAWAITVHKSQGSEFSCVVMPVIFSGGEFFSRNLIYTAITRAKNLIVLVGSKKSLNSMCKQKKVGLRYSMLKEFIILENSCLN